MSNQLPNYGERLLELRKKRCLSQQKVADAIGVSVKTYRSWEIGKSNLENGKTEIELPDLSLKQLCALSDFFDVDIAYILGEQDFQRWRSRSMCEDSYLLEVAAEKITSLDSLQALALSGAVIWGTQLLDDCAESALKIACDLVDIKKTGEIFRIYSKHENDLGTHLKDLKDSFVGSLMRYMVGHLKNISDIKKVAQCYRFTAYYRLLQNQLKTLPEDMDPVTFRYVCDEILLEYAYELVDTSEKLEFSVKSPPDEWEYKVDEFRLFRNDFLDWLRSFDPLINKYFQYIQRQEDGSLLFTCDELRP